MDDDRPAAGAPAYRERLWPAAWVWVATLMLGLSLGLIPLPLSLAAGQLTAVLGALAVAAALVATTPTIGVWDDELHAGRAHVPVGLLGTPDPLDPAAMRHAQGPGLDARAYLCIRGWILTGVRVDLVDPRDPTPYWLLSSRRPDLLADALVTARGAADRS